MKIIFSGLLVFFSFYTFAQSNPEWIIYNTSNSALPSNQVDVIQIDNLNRKWISLYDHGLLKIDDSGWSLFNTGNSGIPSNTLSTINVDNESNLWAGGGGSFILTKFDGANWTTWTSSNISIPGSLRTSLVFDDQNDVWFLSRNTQSIFSTHYLIEFSEDSIWTTHSAVNTSNGYRQLLFDDNQTLWIGDDEGLYFYSGDSLHFIQSQGGPIGLYITDIKMDSSGNFWIAAGLAGWGNLIKYNGTSFTGFPPVATAIEIDSEGNIWVGTESFPNEVELLKYDGSNWTTYNPTNSQLPNTFMITDLAFDTFGNLWIGTGDSGLVIFNENGIVPVELISFSADVDNNNITLNWITESEVNNSGFEIERSETSNGKSQKWLKVGFVEGKGTTTEQQFYSFIDKNLSAGKYQYRLKQIDFDGTFEYSQIIKAEVGLPLEFSLSQNYPNPFNPTTKIKYTIPSNVTLSGVEGTSVTFKVYDILGNEVATLINEEKRSGVYEVEFDASTFSSGIYLYKLNAGIFSEIKKMIYLR